MTMVAIAEPAPVHAHADWPLWKCVAFRFAAAYWVGFLVTYTPGFFDDIAVTRWIAVALRRPMEWLVSWVGLQVFDVIVPTTQSGSGDKLFDWIQAFCIVVSAAIAGAAWCIVDRKRRGYDTADAWLRVALRFGLAVPMISYGMFKVIKLQFASASIDRLLQPYGQSSPMGLLWTFMGYSRGYNVFTGLVETLAGLFLLTQATTPMGALLAVIGMTNVVVLNFTYDVPVKLYSSNLLLMGIFLLLPYAGRLLAILVMNRVPDTATILSSRTPARRRLRFGLKVAATAFVLYLGAWGPIRFRMTNPGDYSVQPALYGLYVVKSHRRGGAEVPALFTDATRWRRVAYNRNNTVTVYFADDSIKRFRATDDAVAHVVELRSAAPGDSAEKLTYERGTNGTLTLHGQFQSAPFDATLEPAPRGSLLLVNRGFSWVQETPFNR